MIEYFSIFLKEVKTIDSSLKDCISTNVSGRLRNLANRALGLETRYLTTSRSKRLRAVLFLTAHSSSACKSLKCLNLALALELIHNASLIVDDIQDKSLNRYGRSTLWAEVGTPVAFNLAILFIVLAQRISESSQFVKISLNQTMLNMIKGQQVDLDPLNEYPRGLKGYLKLAHGKTSALLESAIELGAHAFPPEIRKNLHPSLRAFGVAHQIQDDIDDILESKNIERGNVLHFLFKREQDSKDSVPALLNLFQLYAQLAIDNLDRSYAPEELKCKLRILFKSLFPISRDLQKAAA